MKIYLTKRLENWQISFSRKGLCCKWEWTLWQKLPDVQFQNIVLWFYLEASFSENSGLVWHKTDKSMITFSVLFSLDFSTLYQKAQDSGTFKFLVWKSVDFHMSMMNIDKTQEHAPVQEHIPIKLIRTHRLCDYCDIGMFPDVCIKLCLLPLQPLLDYSGRPLWKSGCFLPRCSQYLLCSERFVLLGTWLHTWVQPADVDAGSHGTTHYSKSD